MVDVLFSKAVEEAHYAEIYARLCRCCHDTWQREDRHSFWFNKQTNKYEPIKRTNSKDSEVKLESFREVLLRRAQHEFMKLKILHVKDKTKFEEWSDECNLLLWKRLDYEEKLKALPPKDSPKVKHTELSFHTGP